MTANILSGTKTIHKCTATWLDPSLVLCMVFLMWRKFLAILRIMHGIHMHALRTTKFLQCGHSYKNKNILTLMFKVKESMCYTQIYRTIQWTNNVLNSSLSGCIITVCARVLYLTSKSLLLVHLRGFERVACQDWGIILSYNTDNSSGNNWTRISINQRIFMASFAKVIFGCMNCNGPSNN